MCLKDEVSYTELSSKNMLTHSNLEGDYLSFCYKLIKNCAKYEPVSSCCYECKWTYDLSNGKKNCEKSNFIISVLVICSLIIFVGLLLMLICIIKKCRNRRVKPTASEILKAELGISDSQGKNELPPSPIVDNYIRKYTNQNGMINPSLGNRWKVGINPTGAWRLRQGRADTRVPPLKIFDLRKKDKENDIKERDSPQICPSSKNLSP